ncbi:MAG TPA: sigma-70 family RNA polymerase sigma factor [Blastocatellia bacterium]|nr:sigma-70 family RNA polymerase sigma factor [Blastocatellia bacterium]
MAEYAEPEIQMTPQNQVRDKTDDELVVAARGGDELAFAQLFKRHSGLVSRLGYRFFTRREQVEEIIQDSFVKAYLALNSYQGGNEKSFVSWLARITVHVCYDELRKIKKRGESRLGDLSQEEEEFLMERLRDVSAGSNVEGATISRDLSAKLLSRLKPEDRVVLTLLKQEELSIAEIAELTGWTSAKVKMRSHRAQQGLRRVLRKFV